MRRTAAAAPVVAAGQTAPPLGTRTVLAFWAPLAATWLMMAVNASPS